MFLVVLVFFMFCTQLLWHHIFGYQNGRSSLPPPRFFGPFLKMDVRSFLGILRASRESTRRMGSQDLDTLVSS